jgi:hypothetical protein
LYKIKSTIDYLNYNYHINFKLKYYKPNFIPSPDIANNSFYIQYGNTIKLVEKEQQNDKNFNILLCRLVYTPNSPCLYCLNHRYAYDPIFDETPTISKLRVINRNKPTYGKYYYVCSNEDHGFVEWEEGNGQLVLLQDLLVLIIMIILFLMIMKI